MNHRLRFEQASELFEAFPAAREDIHALPTDEPSLEFLRGLLSSPTPEDAITFCAYLLPRRIAVWWGHQCLTHLPDVLGDQDHAMLDHAENWVREPDEQRRYEALNAAMDVPVKTPGVWVALGAGWSGGSLMPPDMTPVPPPPHLTARGINAGILSALARISNDQRASVLSAFVEMGIKLTEEEG